VKVAGVDSGKPIKLIVSVAGRLILSPSRTEVSSKFTLSAALLTSWAEKAKFDGQMPDVN